MRSSFARWALLAAITPCALLVPWELPHAVAASAADLICWASGEGNRKEEGTGTHSTAAGGIRSDGPATVKSGPVCEKRSSGNAGTAVRAETYGNLLLSFEANAGQTDQEVKFISRGSGYSLFLTNREAVLALTHRDPKAAAAPQRSTPQTAVLRMQVVGAQSSPEITGQDPLPGKVNYFIGNDPAKWRTDVATYAKVRYGQVYPGIDLVYYGNQRQLEYDFVVAPGADPTRIRLGFTGAQGMQVDAQGGLVVQTAGGTVRWDRPVVYQEVDAQRRSVEGTFVLQRDHQVSFLVAAYDPTKPLVIDPTLVYSTYLGGNADDFGAGIAVDSAGNAYVAGETSSSDFPGTTGGTAGTFGNADIFVTKLDATGSTLIYSTYLGGSGSEGYGAIALDSSGNAYVAGQTDSGDFPTTAGAFQTGFSGARDAFVTKLNAEGNALIFSTYLGGWDFDDATSIAIDSSGNVYVAGQTAGIYSNFPVYNAYQSTRRQYYDAFVTKLNAGGTALLYSTILGGYGNYTYGARSIAADDTGNVYVTGPTSASDFPTTASAFQTLHGGGFDAFVTKLNTNLSGPQSLAYSTFLGGSADDHGSGIAVDGSGYVYVTGDTNSADFPTASALQADSGSGQDAFVAKLDTNASGAASLVYSTYLGGSGDDSGGGIAVDNTGNVYITGNTTSTDFPTTANAFQANYGGFTDAFVTKLSPDGSALLYSTYLGGSDTDAASRIAVDDSGNAYIVGYYTTSTDFPTTNGALQSEYGGGKDTFVAKINTRGQAALTVSAPVSLTYGETATLTASGGSGTGAVTFSAGASTGCSVSGTELSVTNASGTCEVTASRAGDSNYGPTTSAAATVTLQRASQTITVNPAAPASASYNASFGVAATASSGLGVAITTTGGCSGSGTGGSATVTMTSPTTACVVHYNQGGDSNYAAAAEVTSTTTAQKASQTITVTLPPPASAGYNTTFSVAATASSGLGVAITTNGSCSGSGTGSATITMTNATGSCTVRYNQAGNANYLAAPQVSRTTTAQKASQTITVTQHAPLTADFAQSFTVSATASSGLAVAVAASGACSRSGNTMTMTSGTGTCTVTYTQAGNGNYLAATPVPETTTAQKASQTITVTQAAPASAALNSSFSVAATAPGGAVVISVSGVCSLSGSTVTMTSATGTCTVMFDQAGNANYLAAPQVSQLTAATAAKTSQTITVTQHAPATVSTQSSFQVTATATSGLPVSVTVSPSTVCSSIGNTVTTTKKKGTCTVTFSQAGDQNYSPAPQVVETTTVR